MPLPLQIPKQRLALERLEGGNDGPVESVELRKQYSVNFSSLFPSSTVKTRCFLLKLCLLYGVLLEVLGCNGQACAGPIYLLLMPACAFFLLRKLLLCKSQTPATFHQTRARDRNKVCVKKHNHRSPYTPLSLSFF